MNFKVINFRTNKKNRRQPVQVLTEEGKFCFHYFSLIFLLNFLKYSLNRRKIKFYVDCRITMGLMSFLKPEIYRNLKIVENYANLTLAMLGPSRSDRPIRLALTTDSCHGAPLDGSRKRYIFWC